VGSAAGLLLAPPITLPVAETILTIAVGALLATDRPLPLASVACLAILLGLLHGTLNGSELPKTSSAGQISAAGVAAALFVAVSLFCRIIARPAHHAACGGDNPHQSRSAPCWPLTVRFRLPLSPASRSCSDCSTVH